MGTANNKSRIVKIDLGKYRTMRAARKDAHILRDEIQKHIFSSTGQKRKNMSRPGSADVAKRFGRNLTTVLKTIDMSPAELSRRTKLTPAAISQILAGNREPLLSTMIKIMDVIPISFERLNTL
jgi:hypothetical protein